MKQKSKLQKWLPSVAAGLALAGSSSLGLAQDWTNPKTFDTTKGSWLIWWGFSEDGTMLTQDPTLDAANDPNSGSLRWAFPFVGGSGEQMMTFGTLHDAWGWDRTVQLNCVGTYKNLTLDFKLDPSTALNKNGNFGSLAIGLVYYDLNPPNDWKQIKLSDYAIPASATNWTHLVLPIDPTATGLDTVVGYYIYTWSGGSYTNTLMFNVDNIYLQPATNDPPLAPPTMGLEKAGPSGVEIIMDDKNSQWQRNAITTPADSGPYLWTSQGSYPVTYSCTIADFPDIATHAGFEAHMYLVNGDTAGTGDPTNGSADWNAPDILIFRLENTAEGDVLAQIQWKTNYPGANATNVPVAVHAPSAIGTWAVTFTDSTHGTLSGPGLTDTTFELPADVVQNNFSPATSFVQFGMFKADGANDGHNNDAHGTFSRVQIKGAQANSIDDSFSGATLTNNYAWRVTSATAVQYIPPGTAWLVNWTMPATGFYPQSAASITGPWNAAAFTKTYRSGTKTYGLLSQTALPSPTAGFFRLIQRPFSKLQVLLPGETAAPDTVTGKTGTPTPQVPYVPFDIIVNAVDDAWHVISTINDTVTLTSTDPGFYAVDAALVNGTKTFSSVDTYLTAEGTSTITATDTADTTKKGTSAPVSVAP